MKHVYIILQFLLVCSLSIPTTYAQDTMRTFIFGHSLIHHELQVNPTPSQETSMPHWFHFLVDEAGDYYEVAGKYGFLRNHAIDIPTFAQWGFDSVASAWDSDNEPFSAADFHNIMITPGNFIQYQAPYLPYYNDTLTPLSSTNIVFDWVVQQEDSLELYIYENWPDMAGYLGSGFPPTASEWAQYNTYLNAGFHDWHLEYYDSLRIRHPNSCVRMIPVGPVISKVLSQAPFNQIPIDTLYEDDAPHGRPTIYFLAALISYMAMYEQPAPPTYQPPAIIDARIRNNYGTVVNIIWNELMNFTDSLGNSMVFCSPLSTHIEEETLTSDIHLYPNPTTGQLYIDTDLRGLTVEVFDTQGRLLIAHKEVDASIDISTLTDGLYWIKLTNSDTGNLFVSKIWKRR